jgi:hypothetical protein
MNILILHRIPYFKIEYHRGINHDLHNVTYFGTHAALASLPPNLRCRKVARPGKRPPYEEARAWLTDEPQHFDRVISMSEYELLDAAQLRQWLGVDGAPVSQIMLSRDKVLMKSAVVHAGVRAPRFMSLTEFIDAGGSAPWPGLTVLKPHLGASSVDVVVFDDSTTAYKSIASRCSGVAELDKHNPGLSNFEVEEFIDGPILHFDGLVAQGKVLVLSASEYVGTCLRYAQGQPMGSFQINYSDTTRKWAEHVLDAVQIHNGSFHLEAIARRGELVFLEVANRVGGADVVATFELVTGIHLPTWELRILLDEPVCDVRPAGGARGRSWYGWFVYPGHHLGDRSFNGFDGAERFRSSPEVVTWNELAVGAPLPDHITYGAGETALAGIVGTDSPQKTQDWLIQLFQQVRIRTSAPPVPERVRIAS